MKHQVCPGAIASSLALIFSISTLSSAQVNILTANGSNDRPNANLQETQLTPATVSPASFGRIGSFAVDGQVYAQVLYVSGLALPGQGIHNVAYVSTMHNSVFAFDADAMSPTNLIWQVTLGPSVPSTEDVVPEIGILGTGAIDLQAGVLYVVSENLEDFGPVFYIHALDLTTGAEMLNGPTAITAAVPGNGSGSLPNNTIPFDPNQHLQRPGLLLANGSVYIAFGSHADNSPWHGWIISYDASDLSQQTGVFNTTPAGEGGAIWQSGRGLPADDAGNIYAISGNGDYDGSRNFGESILKVPPSLTGLIDWFTPSNWQALDGTDADLSAGPALIAGTHTLIGSDKAGDLYLVNGDSMGHLTSSHSYPVIPPGSSQLNIGYIFNFALWNRPDGAYVYVQPRSGALQCLAVAGASFQPCPVSPGPVSPDKARVGMTLSANGADDTSGILWEITGSAGDSIGYFGTLHAFDASNLSSELWNSDVNSDRDALGALPKFVAPTVANGKVYAPSFSNAVAVYGLLSADGSAQQPAITAVANAASYLQNAVSPGQAVSIFGANLGAGAPVAMQLTDSGLVAASLAGTGVYFDGIPAPLLFASPGQVNAVVPFGIGSDSTQMQVQSQGQWSDPVSIPVAASAPGIFSADSSGTGQGLIFNADGSRNAANHPAAAGSVIVLYLTGVGLITPALPDGALVQGDPLPQPVLPVSAQIAGKAAPVVSTSGVSGFIAGILQVSLQIPGNTPAGSAIPVVVQIGNAASQPNLTLAVQ
jgi:uncharacterized protein (TIGR03437 family)